VIGAIIGRILIVGAKSVIGSWTEHHVIFIGILFMAVVLFMPKGIFGFIRERIEMRMIRKASAPTEAKTSDETGVAGKQA